LLLLRAALAAGRPGDATRRELAGTLRGKGWQDARLAALDRGFAP
jgi:hypothetical protein